MEIAPVHDPVEVDAIRSSSALADAGPEFARSTATNRGCADGTGGR
jgi:hypothetical protein